MSNLFIDAYSDDQIYIKLLEKLVNEHEIECLSPESIKYSSFCRLWSVMMVGSVESMIKSWAKSKDSLKGIYSYLENGIANRERIKRLKEAFASMDISVDQQLFEDFLAIKAIRNAYVHGDWGNISISFIVSRGYPKDLMSFEKRHFERMQKCFEHVMKCLGVAKSSCF